MSIFKSRNESKRHLLQIQSLRIILSQGLFPCYRNFPELYLKITKMKTKFSKLSTKILYKVSTFKSALIKKSATVQISIQSRFFH